MEKWEIALSFYGLTLEQAKKEFGFYQDPDIKMFIVEMYEEDTAPVRV